MAHGDILRGLRPRAFTHGLTPVVLGGVLIDDVRDATLTVPTRTALGEVLKIIVGFVTGISSPDAMCKTWRNDSEKENWCIVKSYASTKYWQ